MEKKRKMAAGFYTETQLKDMKLLFDMKDSELDIIRSEQNKIREEIKLLEQAELELT